MAELADAAPEDVAATFCATLVDEWIRAGVTDAVVCPGSRSTPMAMALAAAEDRLRLQVHLDERSAGFLALGLGAATGRPAVVLTTSGTAVAELGPAVVESHHAGVPLLAVTADRPPEMRDAGAPQTIDQTHVFGRAVRWFHDPGVPAAAASGTWRSLGARLVAEAARSPRGPGPVHLNLPFREPLVGTPGPLPAGRERGRSWHEVPAGGVEVPDWDFADWDLADVLDPRRRGIVVAGPWAAPGGGGGRGDGFVAGRIAAALGWPLLTDARLRGDVPLGQGEVLAVGAADALLRDEGVADALRPEVVLHLGSPVASRVVDTWIGASGATEARFAPHAWVEPGGRAAVVIRADPAPLEEWTSPTVPDRTAAGWAARWAAAEAAAQGAIDEVLAAHPQPTEPAVARSLLAGWERGGALVASSSMPIRDLEWYGRPRGGVEVYANRGANGIDGVTSTAVGVALGTGRPTALLIGDIAFLHDANGLLGVAERGVDLTVVVVDNDGGGIFSFLPQRSGLPAPTFESLFGTPHGVDVGRLAEAHGVPVERPRTMAEVDQAVHDARLAGGARVVHVRTERDANVAVHRELNDAVASAASKALGSAPPGPPPTAAPAR